MAWQYYVTGEVSSLLPMIPYVDIEGTPTNGKLVSAFLTSTSKYANFLNLKAFNSSKNHSASNMSKYSSTHNGGKNFSATLESFQTGFFAASLIFRFRSSSKGYVWLPSNRERWIRLKCRSDHWEYYRRRRRLVQRVPGWKDRAFSEQLCRVYRWWKPDSFKTLRR